VAEPQQQRQPETVSEVITEYLDITAPRTRLPRRHRPPTRADHERATRPVLDNRNLSLEEGNDFA
jgi:hypothetical protein